MIVALILFELCATQVSDRGIDGRMNGGTDGQGQIYMPPPL
jgi:hypothetical protein